MSDGGLMVSMGDTTYTSFLKEEVDGWANHVLISYGMDTNETDVGQCLSRLHLYGFIEANGTVSEYSNTKIFVVLYWEIEARVHRYRLILRTRYKLNELLYFPVQNKETFRVWFINLSFTHFSFSFKIYTDISMWRRA